MSRNEISNILCRNNDYLNVIIKIREVDQMLEVKLVIFLILELLKIN